MRILICSSATNKINRYITDSIYRALCRCLDSADVLIREQCDLAASAKLLRPDVLLIVDGQEANTAQIRRALEYASTSAIWFFEDPYELPSNLISAAPFDQVFTVDPGSTAAYRRGAMYLPLAADPEACLFGCQRTWHHDVSFIGSAWPNRIVDLLTLYRRFPNARWNVRLLSNSTILPILEQSGLASEVRRCGWLLTHESLAIRDVAAIFNRSRITLSLPRRFSRSASESHSRSTSLPPRVFETAMAGSFQLVSQENWDNANPLFPAETIGVYRDLDTASDLIECALQDASRVETFAKRAQAHATSFHSFDSRIVKILDTVNCTARQLSQHRSKSNTANGAGKGPNSLVIVHNRAGKDIFGGVEVFATGLYRSLPSPDCYIAFPDHRGKFIIDSRMHGRIASISARPKRFGDFFPSAESVDQWLEHFIVQHNVRAVYVTHIINWPLSILDRFRSLGVDIFIWLNDFFYMCQSINLVSLEDVYCKMPDLGTRGCDACLKTKFNAPPGQFAYRKATMLYYLQCATKLIAPSRSTQILYESTYPEIKHKIVVQPYFVPALRPPGKRSAESRLSVLVAGNLSFHKGGDDIVSIIRDTGADDVAFHVCGQVTSPYYEQLKALAAHRGGVTLHGSYMPGEVPAAFFQCDVALFLSVWPETYLIALDEAMKAGCVPIVTNVGAPAERVVPGINGFKVDVGDVDRVVEILGEVLKNRERLNGLRDACTAIEPPSEKEVAARVHAMTDWASPPRPVSDQSPTRYLSSGELGIGPKIAWISDVSSVAEGDPSAPVQLKQLQGSRYYLQKFLYTLRRDGIATALRKTGAHFHRFIF